MHYIFRIFRYDPFRDEKPHFQDFEYSNPGNQSVLEALMEIRNQQDCTLGFRYSCREAICGSCGMVINGMFDLACRKDLNSLDSSVVVIEPLPNLEIKKDLIVDLDPFWEALKKVKPYIINQEERPAGGFRINEKEMEEIFQYTNCVMCACCYSVCPVVSRDKTYYGPAALAKFYRFIKDPRDKRLFSDWSGIDRENGVWGCDDVFRCNDVCPKNVRPADGIGALKRKLVIKKLRQVFKGKQ